MKFYTRSEARSAATRAQAKSKHIMLDSVLNEAIKNQEMQNRFDIFLSHAIKDADLILGGLCCTNLSVKAFSAI